MMGEGVLTKLYPPRSVGDRKSRPYYDVGVSVGVGVRVSGVLVGVGVKSPVSPTGMFSTWPTTIKLGSSISLASTMASTVVPYCLARALKVSPATTMCVR